MGAISGDGACGGVFGPTAQASIQITDRSGRVFRAEVYRCINVTTDPQLEDALLSGALYEVGAPGGGEPFRLALPIQYHDEELELFALVVPEALRHREFALRRQLLGELEDAERLPAYARRFETVCGLEALEALVESYRAGDKKQDHLDHLAADGGERVDEVSQTLDAQTDPERIAELDDAWREIEDERSKLAHKRQQLDEERQQLDEVAARIDRERARMDEVEREVAQERQSLEEMRSEIEAMKLNLEQQRLRSEHGAPASNAEESTQVVTEDQFIEIVEDGESSAATEATEATELIDSPYHARSGEAAERTETRITPVDAADLPELEAAESPRERVAVVDGRVFARAQLTSDRLEALRRADDLAFFVQYAEDADYPFVGLLLAALDADEQAMASVGWPLDVMSAAHELVLDRLEAAVELTVVLEAGGEKLAYQISAPLGRNVEWIRRRAQARLAEPNFEAGSFEQAATSWAAAGADRLGSMRHNFRSDSFEQASSPADIKLACGIVGYWSAPENFAYLVSNRSFPLNQFEAIQARVVRRAVQHGLFLNAELRQVAVELGLGADSVELAERLLAEFAELSVGLRANDLDPIQEFENWEALIELAEELGITPDPDVLELAAASLKRAQSYQETE